MRYSQLIAACAAAQPKAILEIGTWNGHRALQMLTTAPKAKYYGFDLFEDATPDTDAAEKNVKAHYSLRGVKSYLEGFDVTLVKGNTRETLARFEEPVDFVWLDGGHSVETIASDWANVRRVLAPDAIVLFDDYYTGIDVSEYGCNSIVLGLEHEVLPMRDPVMDGGWVQMVRVFP